MWHTQKLNLLCIPNRPGTDNPASPSEWWDYKYTPPGPTVPICFFSAHSFGNQTHSIQKSKHPLASELIIWTQEQYIWIMKEILYWLDSCQLDTSKGHLVRGTSIEKITQSEWLIGKSIGHFLDWWRTMWKVALGAIRKQTEWETLEHRVLNRKSLSNPSSQGSENPTEEEA